MPKLIIFLVALLMPLPTSAHGFGVSGFLHPLTGFDHFIAMVAVGSWSAQLGGKALYRVPLAFILMMGVGGLAGLCRLELPFTEYCIAGSVILLGVAIAVDRRLSWFLAAAAVSIFGFYHGFSHGIEKPPPIHAGLYGAGFLLTTCGLHVAGAVGGLLLLDDRSGQRTLRLLGWAVTIIGMILVMRL